MNEIEIIKAFASRFPRSSNQENKLFESDAEIFNIGDTKLAITTDEFCAEEDGFTSIDPVLLGRNLVVATISDLLAVGATPAFFLQVVSFSRKMNSDFNEKLMLGVKRTLEEADAFLLGGDTSVSDQWRYVGTAIGNFSSQAPIQRKTHADKMLIYLTGQMGDGNLMALDNSYQANFELRRNFMKKARPYLSFAIDSSDGLQNALTTLAMINDEHALIIDADLVPIHLDVKAFCAKSSLPQKGFLLGSAGEYELIVGISLENKDDFEAQFPLGEVTRIGIIELSDNPGLFWKIESDSSIREDVPITIDPRFSIDRDAYINEILRVAKKIFE